MKTFEKHESEVRSYCRSFPTVFTEARGQTLRDTEGKEYLDFFSGAGALNYGHNHPDLKQSLLEYLASDGITHSLDMATRAKEEFILALHERILEPRGLAYKMMFTGPTGTNAVEAALKLARKVTGRTNIVAFTNAFHGMTLGALALTGNEMKRSGAGLPFQGVSHVPYAGYFGDDLDSISALEQLLADGSSGLEQPAAIVVETLQAEGGVNVASDAWLRGLSELARKTGALLIVDDIQAGCGRTGPFFSFERAGIVPDMVCLSKSLSGYGTPLALTLLREDLDDWEPGEHNGTFRGHNLAFVTARAALERFWMDDSFERETRRKGEVVRQRLDSLAADHGGETRGLGLLQGLEFEDPEAASRLSREAFSRGLLFETSGPKGEVVKVMPPLTITDEELERGLSILEEVVREGIPRTGAETIQLYSKTGKGQEVSG